MVGIKKADNDGLLGKSLCVAQLARLSGGDWKTCVQSLHSTVASGKLGENIWCNKDV